MSTCLSLDSAGPLLGPLGEGTQVQLGLAAGGPSAGTGW